MGNGERLDAVDAARLGRRQFLRRAAVAGTVAFAVPTIITMEPAGAAALTSPPPVDPAEIAKVAGPQVAVAELPRTGVGTDELIVAGLAATAGGAALLFWSADGARSGEVPDPTT